jgi:hypothetical protein
MSKATHNGTCQCCGSQQAVRAKGLANHGYTMDYGFFSGICAGSYEQPVEISTDLLDQQVEKCNARIRLIEAATCPTELGPLRLRWVQYGEWIGKKNPSGVMIINSPEELEGAMEDAKQDRKSIPISTLVGSRTPWDQLLDLNEGIYTRQARELKELVTQLTFIKESRAGKPLLSRG